MRFRAIVLLALLCTTQMSRAQTTGQTGTKVGGSMTDRSHPGLGWPNPLRLPKPLIDPSGNIVHRNIEIVNTDSFNAIGAEANASPVIVRPTLTPGPPINASLLLPASMKGGPILIDIDVMQVFIPWEFRVAGTFER